MLPRTALGQTVAHVLLWVFVAALSSPALTSVHSTDLAGDACADRVWPVAHPVDQFETVLPPVDSEHCPLCHWIRAVSGAAPRPAVSAVCQLDRSTGVSGFVERLPVHPVSTTHASRAPPAAV